MMGRVGAMGCVATPFMAAMDTVMARVRGTFVLPRVALVLVIVLLILGVTSGTAPDSKLGGGDDPPSTALRKKVLLIGVDGVRPDVLAEVATPNIDALIAQGAFSANARTGYPSVSGPGWSSMLTGVWPEKHGVTNNNFENKRYDEYPDFLTRIESIRPELNTFVVADWLPLVTDDHNGPVIGDALDVKHILDGYAVGFAEADDRSVELAVDHLEAGDPDAMFVYLGNPDETSHHFRSIGEEYRGAIELADEHVGRLVAAIRARPTYGLEDWLILMSTDHGRRADGGHGGDTPAERTIFYLASGPSAEVGTLGGTPSIVDVPVTALSHLSIGIDPTRPLDGEVVGLVRPSNPIPAALPQ
jgi:predicted AlkP superfamily pyrophosphatase or phosphodiesterase